LATEAEADEGKTEMTRTRNLMILVLALAGAAAARDHDGALDLIYTPNNGTPALTARGGSFDAVLREKAALKLTSGDKEYPLAVEWSDLPGGRQGGYCTAPADAPAGLYTLAATAGDKTDTMPRAVALYDAFPEYYVIAHLSDLHIGAAPKNGQPVSAVVRELLQAVNASEAVFAIVTGDVTDGGAPEQFQEALGVLDTCTKPTFLTPGNHDRTGANYERYFGPLTYVFQFGRDGYLGFDTKDYLTADERTVQDGLLQVYRRAIKASRWAVGFSHRYEPGMDMRSQLVLFVDDPLDFMLFGHIHRENDEKEQITPWGTTHLSAVPAAMDGKFRFIDVTAKDLLFRPVKGAEKPEK
jgi:hypothetical protein